MKADIAWWNLAQSEPGVDELREHLGADAPIWRDVPGLRVKLWITDQPGRRWGAIMLWENNRPPLASLPPNIGAELIGRPPDTRVQFEVEASVEGLHSLPGLDGLGPVFAI